MAIKKDNRPKSAFSKITISLAPADIRAKVKDLPSGKKGRTGEYVNNLKKGIV